MQHKSFEGCRAKLDALSANELAPNANHRLNKGMQIADAGLTCTNEAKLDSEIHLLQHEYLLQMRLRMHLATVQTFKPPCLGRGRTRACTYTWIF